MTPDDRKAADMALAVSFGAKTYCEVGKPETLTIGTVSLLQLIAEVREQAKAEALAGKALRLTKRELELVFTEMNAAVDNGAEDPDYETIKRKASAALRRLKDKTP